MIGGADFSGAPAMALALRASPTQLIGFALVKGDWLDTELLDELVFDVESALAARMITRLRAEELAVLENPGARARGAAPRRRGTRRDHPA